MFQDRFQAGNFLALKLSSLKERFDVVLAIPRGGVVVGKVISDVLKVPLGVIYAKKIPTSGQPELAAGAQIVKDEKFGPTPAVSNKSVILTDDGIATGATVEAAVGYLKKKGAIRILIAVPVAPKEVVEQFRSLDYETIVLQEPENFQAVGEFYKYFPQVTDKEVLQLLQK